MFYIAHRGNVQGPNKSFENDPEYILEAIDLGFTVEIDVWFLDNHFYLGHDKPQYLISSNFLIDNKYTLWCHAKNALALKELLSLDTNCFWHNIDDMVVTSKGYIWAYPGKELTELSIAVMPETVDCFSYHKTWTDIDFCAGICSDFIMDFKYENSKIE
jgi:hypothetical protein